MSNFSEAIKEWIDDENLIGSSMHPTKWSTGNALLETSIAIAMEVELNGASADVALLRRLVGGMGTCVVAETSFNKNPMRTDQITHDDLIGAAATQRIVSTSFATHIVRYGQRNGWNLTNNGQTYWDAQAKPWEIAFYELASGQSTSLFNLIIFMIEILISAVMGLFKKGSPSGHRLTWLKLLALHQMTPGLATVSVIWRMSMQRMYKNVGAMMRAYYNNDTHPFVVFGEKLKF